MTTYTTKSGDMWDSIAKSQLGNEKYMTQLMENNEKYIKTVVFSAGIILNIPEIETSTPTYLPPWR